MNVDKYYRVINISGQEIVLDVRDRNNNKTEITIAEGETLDWLNEHAMKFLWRYLKTGLISVETEWGDFKPNWKKEGF